MQPILEFAPVPASMLHVQLPTPLQIPVGTAPQPVASFNIAALKQDYNTRFAQSPRSTIPPVCDVFGRVLYSLLLSIYLTRTDNLSSSLYFGIRRAGESSWFTATTGAGTARSGTLFPRLIIEDSTQDDFELGLSSNIAGWTLWGYTVYVSHAFWAHGVQCRFQSNLVYIANPLAGSLYRVIQSISLSELFFPPPPGITNGISFNPSRGDMTESGRLLFSNDAVHVVFPVIHFPYVQQFLVLTYFSATVEDYYRYPQSPGRLVRFYILRRPRLGV